MRKLKERVYTRKCKTCKEKFEPRGVNQIVCSATCAAELQRKMRIRISREYIKDYKRKNREAKAKLKTTSSHLQDLQKIFNKWVVLRDKSLPCISCGVVSGVRFSCGHYWTQGSYPNLRIDPDNAHKQCWFNCNKNKRGNLAEYTPNLIKKIGQKRYDDLYQRRNTTLKLSIPEIADLKELYRTKIKQLNK